MVVLALVQGVTEFLPVSSSAHLVLAHEAFGAAAREGAERLALDVALHLGALGAVVVYFLRDLARIARAGLVGLLPAGGGRPRAPGWALGWLILAATVPVAAAGLLFKDGIIAHARTTEIIAWTTLLFGLALWAADRTGGFARRLGDMNLPHAMTIGMAQALAVIPGVSRSGIAMTAARALGYDRAEAARFSLILSIPAVAGASLLAGRDLLRMGDANLTSEAALGAALAFAAALAAIAAMMRWLSRASFAPFVAYRCVLGLGLLAWVYL